MEIFLRVIAVALGVCLSLCFFGSIERLEATTGNSLKAPPLVRSSDLIQSQDQGKSFPKILANNDHEPIFIRVSLSQQRAFLYVGKQLAIETPISSGKRSGWTPLGLFTIFAKEPNHYSTIYGNFVNTHGHIVREGVCSRTDSAPSGTHFQGAPMLYFMALTNKIGFHVGCLPGYPSSHGCIRLPHDMAQLFYEHTPLKTAVSIEP